MSQQTNAALLQAVLRINEELLTDVPYTHAALISALNRHLGLANTKESGLWDISEETKGRKTTLLYSLRLDFSLRINGEWVAKFPGVGTGASMEEALFAARKDALRYWSIGVIDPLLTVPIPAPPLEVPPIYQNDKTAPVMPRVTAPKPAQPVIIRQAVLARIEAKALQVGYSSLEACCKVLGFVTANVITNTKAQDALERKLDASLASKA